MRRIQSDIKLITVRRREYLLFGLLDYRFFRDSETGNVLFVGTPPTMLARLVTIPYIVVNEVFLFRSMRFLARIDGTTIGILAVREEPDALFVKSLAVLRQWRRQGVATFMLDYACRLARKFNKNWLELGVLKANTNAQKLYVRHGFRVKTQSERMFTLRKSIEHY